MRRAMFSTSWDTFPARRTSTSSSALITTISDWANNIRLRRRRSGTIHPGADDNASGAAGVLALARYFGSHPQPARGILFVAFAGEELGLLGSTHYVNHPLLPLNRAVGDDQHGHDRPHPGSQGDGWRRACRVVAFRRILDTLGPKHDLDLDLSDTSVYGSSDHTSFKAKQVPTLFFFSGLHADYHRPTDTWDKIDADSTVRLLKLIADLTLIAGTPSGKPQFAHSIFQRFSTASTKQRTREQSCRSRCPRSEAIRQTECASGSSHTRL